MRLEATITFPAAPLPAPPPAPSNLYDIKIRTVEWLDQPAPTPGSFAIIGGRGQQNWIRLGSNEIGFIRSIKIPALLVDNDVLWKWAAQDAGTIYIRRDDVAMTADWVVGLMSSMSGHPRQFCQLESPLDLAKPYQRVSGIPYQTNGDYSAFTPDKHPEFWFFCPTVYPPTDTQPNGYLGWTSHNNLIFYMPFFDARTFPKKSSDAALFGGLIATNVFVGPHI